MKDIRQKTVAIIISDVDKAIAFEWIASSLKQDFRLIFLVIGNNTSALYQYFKQNSIAVYSLPSRNGVGQIITLVATLWRLLLLRPRVVHTHLIKANLVGLTAAWLLRVPKRIYTRHHALVHHTEYPKGLWIDKWSNHIATHIIAISKNIENILTTLEGASIDKVKIIHHGFDLDYFTNITTTDIEQLRANHKIPNTKPIIGVVARYQPWKGIQYAIPAFNKLLKEYPNAHLVLANAFGPYQTEIKKLLQRLPENSYTEIAFEYNAPALFRLFDVYIHTPIDAQSEAFGQTYIEALASGVPAVFTLSGVATEFIQHNENALVVPFCDSESIHHSILRILREPELQGKLVVNGHLSVKKFSLEKMIDPLRLLYGS